MKKIFCALAIVAITAFNMHGQNRALSGIVADSTGDAIQFAIVTIQGTYQSVQTKSDGSFQFSNLSDTIYCISVHMIGYENFKQCYNIPNSTVRVTLKKAPYQKDEIVVSSTRADQNSGVAYTNISKEELASQNYGQDLPIVLNTQTSVVTTSDAGNGFGYTGLRIRGSDANRINVTINGIPVNDAESQGTFWVDLPDVVSSAENIQLQRGVGTSTNGAGSFGGTLNLQTELNRKNSYSEMVASGGSFNSWRGTAKAGTGIIGDHWSFDMRLSQLGSDGFIDRGRSDLHSWYFSGGYYGDKLMVKGIMFGGRERTYQCWYGVSEDSINAGNFTYNSAGEYFDSSGNAQYYKDQIDAYGQDYYQLHFVYAANQSWTINWSLHATKGKGYYEEYKEDQSLSEYLINDTSSTLNDLVRRRWLDNWFYGITYAAQYNSLCKTQFILGGASNVYEGKHFGEVITAIGIPAGTSLGGHYYDDYANKQDNNVFAKLNYSLRKNLNAYLDLQARSIRYSFTGFDTTGSSLPQQANYLFFNPKAGLTALVATRHTVYFSFGVGNKEPNRDDFTNSSPSSRPLHETLYDFETGWKFGGTKLGAEVNLYYMHYTNQLVLTGRVNDVGAYTRENVDASFRRGVEVSFGYLINKQFSFTGNVTLSQNKIESFTEFLDNYDNYTQEEITYTNTSIGFSPSIISAGTLTWNNNKGLSASVIGKYVSKQYLDNTTSEDRKIDPYFTLNMITSWMIIKPSSKTGQKISELTLGLQVNNLLNTMYSSNGYTYGFISDAETSRYNYYYPQAGINAMGMLTMKFGSVN